MDEERPIGKMARITALSDMILELIPVDEWVSASEIAGSLGLSPQRVGTIIRERLLYQHVERRFIKKRGYA